MKTMKEICETVSDGGVEILSDTEWTEFQNTDEYLKINFSNITKPEERVYVEIAEKILNSIN